jgi:hypothetical protein
MGKTLENLLDLFLSLTSNLRGMYEHSLLCVYLHATHATLHDLAIAGVLPHVWGEDCPPLSASHADAERSEVSKSQDLWNTQVGPFAKMESSI